MLSHAAAFSHIMTVWSRKQHDISFSMGGTVHDSHKHHIFSAIIAFVVALSNPQSQLQLPPESQR